MKEISKKNFDGYKYVDGGVCAARGFKANGLYCGIKGGDNDYSGAGLKARQKAENYPAEN